MEVIVALLTLILLEVVLGIDNIIFISIVTARLPVHQQKKGRQLGLVLAMVMRLLLLTIISFILKLQGNLFTVFSMDISGKDLILIAGGLFLLYKSATEIHQKMEGETGDTSANIKVTTFSSAISQILILDLVFSIDSIITAVGMVDELWVMYTAVVVSVGVMLFASEPISKFVNNHPAFKMLALSFLLLIGVSLIAEGLAFHIPKGYIYFSMAFALLVDIFQMKMSKTKTPPVQTHEHYMPNEAETKKGWLITIETLNDAMVSDPEIDPSFSCHALVDMDNPLHKKAILNGFRMAIQLHWGKQLNYIKKNGKVE